MKPAAWVLLGVVALVVGTQASAQSTPTCFGPPDDDSSPTQFWAGAEYLLWWRKPVCLKPPILTVGNPADAIPGAIGQPGTRVVMGETKFEFAGASGVRPTIGAWILEDDRLGIEATGLFLQRGSNTRQFQTRQGSPATYISYQDPGNTQRALPFSVPGLVNGSSFARGTSEIWGGEVNLLSRWAIEGGGTVLCTTLMVGYRNLDLKDRVEITQTQSLVVNPGIQATGSDTFSTSNQFHGAQVGCRLGVSHGRWSLDYRSSLAVGETRLVSRISGSPLASGQVVAPGLVPGPILALPSNVGEHRTTRVSLVPEVSMTARCQVLEGVTLSLGYNFLYWNKVLCPGDQMDPHANLAQLPGRGPVTGAADPKAPIVFTDFFAQGLTAGVEVQF